MAGDTVGETPLLHLYQELLELARAQQVAIVTQRWDDLAGLMSRREEVAVQIGDRQPAGAAESAQVADCIRTILVIDAELQQRIAELLAANRVELTQLHQWRQHAGEYLGVDRARHRPPSFDIRK